MAVIVAMTLFTVLSATVIYRYISGIFLEEAAADFEVISEDQAANIKKLFQNTVVHQEMMSRQPIIKNYLSQEERVLQDELVLEELNSFNVENKYSAIYVLDSTGTTLVSTNPAFVGKNYAFREYFKSAINNVPWMDVSLGVTTQEVGYYFSRPLLYNGKIEGVLVSKMKPSVVAMAFDGSGQSDHDIKKMFVDKYGVIVYTNYPERLFSTLGNLSPEVKHEIEKRRRFQGLALPALQYSAIQESLSRVSTLKVFHFFDPVEKEKEVMSIAKIEGFPFYVVFEEDVDAYTAKVLRIIFLLLVTLFSAGVLSVVLVRGILERLFAPLEKLIDAVHRIGGGSVLEKVEIETGDELEEFAVGFNLMVESLEKSKQEVEAKIEAQTGDLREQKQYLENQQRALLNILEDVEEERVRNEGQAKDLEKFQMAMENTSDHIVITDPDGMILYANPAVEKITGFKRKEIMGKKAGTIENWGGLMSQKAYEKMWKTIKEKKKPFSAELHQQRKNGDPYDVLAHISPVLNDENEVLFFVGLERDITQEKQIDRAKTELVSLASHQLRTPLSTINWYTEMLLAGDAGDISPDQQEYLTYIYEGNQRMVKLVNSLLNVSRIELGTFAIDPIELNLEEIADTVLSELVVEIKEKKFHIKKDFQEEAKLYHADPNLVRILFQNLLTNAVKYTPKGGTITVRTKKVAKKLQIEVSDTGYGIPSAQQEKIFTKLFRADNVRSKDTQGSGLGLYLVKAIVEESGGKIKFKSIENKGTTFTMSLPLSGMKKKEGAKSLS